MGWRKRLAFSPFCRVEGLTFGARREIVTFMEPTYIRLRFSDPELAQALIDATPPDGVCVSGSMQPIVRASAGADIVFYVSFQIKAHLDLAIVALWVVRELLPHVKKRRNKKTRINDENVTLTKGEVLRLMRDVIHWQEVRDAQRHESDDKKRIEDKKSPG
jgi:hypothetical protein